MRQLKILVNKAQDIGTMSVQQDAVGASAPELYGERGLMAVLSDGVGGLQAGERFSEIAVREMLNVHATDDADRGLCERLEDAYLAARREALEFTRREQVEGGATVAAALIHRNECAFLSVGDSRVYLLRGGGLIQLNREQTLGHQLDERAALGLTLREEAERSLYRSALTNHLAEEEDLPWDRCTRPFRLRPGDKLALVSDGVFKALGDGEIERALSLPGTGGARAMCEMVRAQALEKQDNYSALVIAVMRHPQRRNRGGRK